MPFFRYLLFDAKYLICIVYIYEDIDLSIIT